MLQLVFAYCETRNVKGEIEMAFGLNDGLPWKHISQDFKNFKARTQDTTLIMGAKTFMSLPGNLPGRESIVLSSIGKPIPKAKNGDEATQYVSPERINAYLKYHPDKNFSVIGGSELLQSFAPIADRIVLTKIIKKHYVPSTVKLPIEFVQNIRRGGHLYKLENSPEPYFEMSETHFYKIDKLTDIMETMYVKA